MTTRYVGIGGNDSNDGLSWANRKLTLNGVEDTPVAAGDTVYVGTGTYREMLTCDVSGSSGSPITYIGDYDGSHTDGTGGIVRITASDNDQTMTRSNSILYSGKNYRTFKSINFDSRIYAADATQSDLTIENCYFDGNSASINNGNYYTTNLIVRNCVFTGFKDACIYATGANSLADSTNNIIENCLFYNGTSYSGAINIKQGGTTIRNCAFFGQFTGINVDVNTGQTVTVNNCLFAGLRYALKSAAAGELTEDYNNIVDCEVARTNVSTGANSLAYLNYNDSRWFFEMVGGGSMLMPFDLASYSGLINVAGTSPTTADMRGTTVQGSRREWGALEYDSTLDIEAGAGGGLLTNPGMSGGMRG